MRGGKRKRERERDKEGRKGFTNGSGERNLSVCRLLAAKKAETGGGGVDREGRTHKDDYGLKGKKKKRSS